MYILAIDGGGTKTSAVICDATGRIYAKVMTTRSNPTAMNAQFFEMTLHELMQQLRQQNEQIFEKICSCFVGMAGVKELHAEPIVEKIIRQYVQPTALMAIENDGLAALYAGTFGQPGIVQIAGTGAITIGYDENKVLHRIGGWGYLFDDKGSGYYIGMKALEAVFQSYDGRMQNTSLTQPILQHFHVESVEQLIACIYNDEHPRTNIAPLSKYVMHAVESGDAVATGIMDEACVDFYKAIKVCFHKMAWSKQVIQVVLAGGVFGNIDYFKENLQQLASNEPIKFEFKKANLEPIGGAVIGAFKQKGIQLDEAFGEVFNSYWKVL
ncbi:BadF/BadG/BcrA/BcrD ATPase family protein [Metasolibacillus meyeri]|uniref:BadF/BadG/BcrA/BcrD ATPase family protein n=1 Tax=Metasolibacillus meyeri TaxID=1071052 RepID=A0AAW9NU04_9BACL|nr:BadF/BadG/BcrA/BcrD ATPase family protein [Metasolibacillus meyeri]MEC1178278.1 BadF/BadG/BcrA/BcrD ATPase family protein [Metasolibacillus meyeri]